MPHQVKLIFFFLLNSLFFNIHGQVKLTKYSGSDPFEVQPVILDNLEVEEESQSNDQSLFEPGVEMLESSKLDDALYFFSNLIDRYPELGLPHYFKGIVFYEKKDIEQAILSLKEAFKIDPLLFQAKYFLGLSYIEIKKLDEAEQIMKELTEIQSFAANGYFGLGLVMFEKQYPNFNYVVRMFDKAIEIDSSFLPPYIPLASIYYYRGREKKAYEILNKAVSSAPEWEKAIIARAMLSVEVDQGSDQFEKDLEKLISIDPDNYNYYSLRGFLNIELGNYEQAVFDMRKSLNIEDTTRNLTLNFRTKLYRSQELMRTLNYYYSNIYDLGLTTREYVNKGFCEIFLNNFASAGNYFDSAAFHSSNAVIFYAKATAFMHSGQTTKALQSYSQVIERDSSNSYVYLLRAGIYEKRMDNDSAIMDYSRYIISNPSNETGYVKRGMIYYSTSRFLKAYYDFSKAIAINDRNPQLLLRRAVCSQNLQQYSSSNFDLDIIINRPNSYKYLGAYYFKHLNYLYLGDSNVALINLDSAATYDPYNEKLHLRQIELANILNKPEFVKKALDRLVKYFYRRIEYYLKRGSWYYTNADYEDAIYDLIKYTQVYPKDGSACYILSKCYEQLNMFDQASKWLAKAKKNGYEPQE